MQSFLKNSAGTLKTHFLGTYTLILVVDLPCIHEGLGCIICLLQGHPCWRDAENMATWLDGENMGTWLAGMVSKNLHSIPIPHFGIAHVHRTCLQSRVTLLYFSVASHWHLPASVSNCGLAVILRAMTSGPSISCTRGILLQTKQVQKKQ